MVARAKSGFDSRRHLIWSRRCGIGERWTGCLSRPKMQPVYMLPQDEFSTIEGPPRKVNSAPNIQVVSFEILLSTRPHRMHAHPRRAGCQYTPGPPMLPIEARHLGIPENPQYRRMSAVRLSYLSGCRWCGGTIAAARQLEPIPVAS